MTWEAFLPYWRRICPSLDTCWKLSIAEIAKKGLCMGKWNPGSSVRSVLF